MEKPSIIRHTRGVEARKRTEEGQTERAYKGELFTHQTEGKPGQERELIRRQQKKKNPDKTDSLKKYGVL